MTKYVFHFVLLACAGLVLAEGTVQWQQVGGVLGVGPAVKGMVSQGYETQPLDDGAITVQSGFLAHPLLLNNAPFVVSPLADLTLAAGFLPRSIDLDSGFADFDGPLSYTVLATGTGSQASVAGGILHLTSFGTSGVAEFIVSASDGTFLVSDTFTVTAQTATGILAWSPKAQVVGELAVALTKIFALPASGSGRGELGSASTGDESHLAVNLLLPSAGSVSVHIFDLLGNPVIDFDRAVDAIEFRRLAASGDGRRVLPVIWNLRSAHGVAVPAGVYLWQIEMRTDAGQKLTTYKRLGVKGVN